MSTQDTALWVVITIVIVLAIFGVIYYESGKTRSQEAESPSELPYYDQLSQDGTDYENRYYRPQYFKHRRMRIDNGWISSEGVQAYGNAINKMHYDKSCMYAP